MTTTFQFGDVPRILSHLLPESEQENAHHVCQQLSSLASLTDRVASAVALFSHTSVIAHRANGLHRADWFNDEAKGQAALVRTWPFIAAESLSIAVHDFAYTRSRIINLSKQLKTVWTMVDQNAVTASNKFISKYFPNIEQMRHAVCHAGAQSIENPKAIKKHAISSPGQAALFIQGFLSGTRFECSYNGRLWDIEVSEDTVEKLVEVRDAFFGGFLQIEPEQLRQAKEAWKKRKEGRLVPSAQSG